MHTSFDLMLSLLLVWGALMPEAVLANDAAEWCEYVQSTPEPALLFYNRIPKSGSTTMEAVIRRQRKELMEFDYFPAPSKFWDQDFSTGTWPAKLYEYVNGQKQGSSRPMTVIDGHIQYFDFNMMKITKRANNRVEFMQLFRTCVDRAVSHYYFKIYDCIDANKAKHEQRYEKYKQGLFGTVDISACKQNDTCLQNSGVFQRVSTGMIAGYFSGASCAKPCSQVKKIGAARRNVAATSGRYVTFGPLELLSEYLEMLECVYPTYFSGIIDSVMLCDEVVLIRCL